MADAALCEVTFRLEEEGVFEGVTPSGRKVHGHDRQIITVHPARARPDRTSPFGDLSSGDISVLDTAVEALARSGNHRLGPEGYQALRLKLAALGDRAERRS
jgi:hypothetical protein